MLGPFFGCSYFYFVLLLVSLIGLGPFVDSPILKGHFFLLDLWSLCWALCFLFLSNLVLGIVGFASLWGFVYSTLVLFLSFILSIFFHTRDFGGSIILCGLVVTGIF